MSFSDPLSSTIPKFDGFMPQASGRPLFGRGLCVDEQNGKSKDSSALSFFEELVNDADKILHPFGKIVHYLFLFYSFEILFLFRS